MSNANLSSSNVYFGGPDLNKNNLRDILLRAIEASPSEGSIDWMCYYLNDATIQHALIEAASRGVTISIFIDANPRTPRVNKTIIQSLRKHQIPNLKIIDAHKKPLWEYFGLNWHPHFHSKLYYFSHPAPQVFVGSYNPTAGADELPEDIICEIGDHSISHNLLVNIKDSRTVALLHKYIVDMHKNRYRTFARLSSSHNKTHHTEEWKTNFLPTLCSHPIQNLLTRNEKAEIKCAISHLKGPGVKRILTKALQSGKKLEVLLDSTRRRVSPEILSFFDQHHVPFHQPKLPANCLMHNKYILYKSKNESSVMFGSYNWSVRSRYLNHEVLVTTKKQ